MKPVLRVLLVALLVAALPLRGTAGVLMPFCDTQHGGAEAAHEHGDDHSHEADENAGDPTHTASVCSLCASCCAGAGLANVAFAFPAAFGVPGTCRIPFLACAASGHVPGHPDRPPLAA